MHGTQALVVSYSFKSRDLFALAREGAEAALWGRLTTCGRLVIGLLVAALAAAAPAQFNGESALEFTRKITGARAAPR